MKLLNWLLGNTPTPSWNEKSQNWDWSAAAPAGPWPPSEQKKVTLKARPAIDNLPLRQEVITGFRKYSLVWQDGQIALKGSFGGIWTERKMRASCGSEEANLEKAARRCEEHLASLDCQCGIYAHDVPPNLGPGQVGAQVVAFGIVWPHTQGWRASEARIEALTYRPQSRSPLELEIVKALEERFGVKVNVPMPTLWEQEYEPMVPNVYTSPKGLFAGKDPYFLPGLSQSGVFTASPPTTRKGQASGPSFAGPWR